VRIKRGRIPSERTHRRHHKGPHHRPKNPDYLADQAKDMERRLVKKW